jgi:hypothetical protein
MSTVLTLCCDNGDCQAGPDHKPAKVHGEEEICFSPMPSVNYPGGGAAHGHLQARYAEGLLEDLHTAAKSAGWHCDESEWFCPRCTRARIMRGWTRPEEIVARALDV